MKTIPLTQGLVGIVDDADFERVSAYKWHAHKADKNFYPRHMFLRSGVRVWERLHTFLMPEAVSVDHIDGNGLNNQRHNLRPATSQQNRWGFRRRTSKSSSKFRGVYWSKKRAKWVSQLTLDYKNLYLGIFENEEDAARAYDAAARRHFGEFASPNFP